MAGLDELRRGIGQAWENLAAGWQELRERAGHALTRFHKESPPTGVETRDERLARATPEWGILPVEVSQHEDRLEVRLEAPGLEPDDFDVYVQDGNLVVVGNKHFERETSQGEFYIMERAYGRFQRVVPLPCAVAEDKAQARYRRGVLRVTLPRLDRDRGRRIDVKPAR